MGERFGSGSRGEYPKQFLDVGGRSMLIAAAEPFLENDYVDEIVFVTPIGFARRTCELVVRELGGVWFYAHTGIQKLKVSFGGRDVDVRVVHGGADRAGSVRAGLRAAGEEDCAVNGGLVLIHDAARPFVSAERIGRVLEAAHVYGAAVPVIKVRDTVYIEGEGGFADGISDRSSLRGAQTPQGFDLALITEAHESVLAAGLTVTDDGSPVLAHGGRVALLEGEPSNIKVTVAEDLPAGTYHSGSAPRVGIGFDAHRFEEGRALVLGGVNIPFGKGLAGHSDADVLTHALMDAILGALREGDIGVLFPDTDPAYTGISSMELLDGVVLLMGRRGYKVVNADMTLVAEQPRMAPYREEIEKRLAEALRTAAENVSLKATTTEKLGFTGREEGIAAEAIVLLRSK